MDCILGNMGTERLSGIEIQAFLETVLIGTPAVKKKKKPDAVSQGISSSPTPPPLWENKIHEGKMLLLNKN